MRVLPLPRQSAEEVYATCIRRVRNRELSARLRGIVDAIVGAGDDYKEMARAQKLHKFPRAAIIGGNVTTAEMVKVYTGRFVPKACDARPIYDEIFSAAPRGRCPLCGVGQVTTLDHHLPKAYYPVLSVTPSNLIPSCTWCQDAKMEVYPRTVNQQTLHPYFDNFENERWLVSEVIETTPAVFSFYVERPAGWSDIDVARLQRHLAIFDLNKLFASNAADELINIRSSLEQLYAAGGAGAVSEHLSFQANSREKAAKNSWQTAMYKAAEASEWFCDGGFAGA